jgi:ubiquinone/menaquinone biosynthesis C-methylase UbiE
MINTWEKYWMKNAGVDFLRVPHQLSHPIRRKIVDVAVGMGVKSVLEVGCASCIDYPLFRDAGIRYVGVDVTEKMIGYAKSYNPDVDIRQGTIYNLPFKDGEFDSAYVKDVLEHLPAPGAEKVDYHDAVRELWRVSGKVMMLGFFIPPSCSERYRYEDEVWLNTYRRDEVKELIRGLPGFGGLEEFNKLGYNNASLYVVTRKPVDQPT